MVLVELEDERERRQILKNKKKLKGKEIWMEKDLTWKERKVRRSLRQIAIKEESKGKRVWVEQDRIRIKGEWWIWDEERENLRDSAGK